MRRGEREERRGECGRRGALFVYLLCFESFSRIKLLCFDKIACTEYNSDNHDDFGEPPNPSA